MLFGIADQTVTTLEVVNIIISGGTTCAALYAAGARIRDRTEARRVRTIKISRHNDALERLIEDEHIPVDVRRLVARFSNVCFDLKTAKALIRRLEQGYPTDIDPERAEQIDKAINSMEAAPEESKELLHEAILTAMEVAESLVEMHRPRMDDLASAEHLNLDLAVRWKQTWRRILGAIERQPTGDDLTRPPGALPAF